MTPQAGQSPESPDLRERVGTALYGPSYLEAHEPGSIYEHISREQDEKVSRVLAVLTPQPDTASNLPRPADVERIPADVATTPQPEPLTEYEAALALGRAFFRPDYWGTMNSRLNKRGIRLVRIPQGGGSTRE